jgi:hypothetical protein
MQSESSAKQAFDHTGTFWAFLSGTLEVAGEGTFEVTRRRCKYGWKLIPTDWKKDKEVEMWNEMEAKLGTGKANVDEILSDMIQLLTDVALRCGLIPKIKSYYV